MPASLDIRWLIDQGLPQVAWADPDTLPLAQAHDGPLAASATTGRWLVTRDRRLLEDADAPGQAVVLLIGGPWTEEALSRNLRYFQFSLARSAVNVQPAQRPRFIMEMDCCIYRLHPEGGVEELQPWRAQPVRKILAAGAPA